MKKKGRAKHHTHRLRRRAGDAREVAAQLAPLEELDKSRQTAPANGSKAVAQENGAIVVGGGEQSNLAKEVIEVEEPKGPLGFEPVIIVILGLMLVFIAFMAWQISQMPSPK